MSRSERKNPIVKENGRSKKEDRTLANRRNRRKLKDPDFDEIGNGCSYKKHNEQYDIYDWTTIQTKEQAIAEYEAAQNGNPISSWIIEKYPTLEKWLKQWDKIFKRK